MVLINVTSGGVPWLLQKWVEMYWRVLPDSQLFSRRNTVLVRFGSYSRGDMLQWKVRRRHWYSGDFGDKQLPVNECYVIIYHINLKWPYYEQISLSCLSSSVHSLEFATPYTMEMMLRKRCVGGKIGIVITADADQILTELFSRRHIAFPILCSTACPPLSNAIKVTKNIEVD